MQPIGPGVMVMRAARVHAALLVLNGALAVFKVRSSERATLMTEFPGHSCR